MQYCINALLKNNNEIMQYYIINNDIALIMHYCALLQMPDSNRYSHEIFQMFLNEIIRNSNITSSQACITNYSILHSILFKKHFKNISVF